MALPAQLLGFDKMKRLLLPTDPPLPVRGTLVMAFFVPVVIQWLFVPPSDGLSLVLSTMLVIVLAAVVVLPAPSSAALIAIDALTTVLSNGTGPTSTYGALFGLGLLSYLSSNCTTTILTAITCVMQIGCAMLSNDWHLDWYMFMSIVPFNIIAAMTGRSLHWREDTFKQREELLRAQERLNQTEFTAHTAQRMHDAVTGELSFIARMAQRRIGEGSADAEDWRQINESALNALDNTHQVIDSLDEWARGSKRERSSNVERDTIAHLRHILDDNDRRIRHLGFHGQSILSISEMHGTMDGQRIKLCIEFIGEVYSNIIRHAKPESKYEISVMWTAEGIEITTSNQVDDDQLPQHGQGLEYYRRQVERIGGRTVTERSDDGSWFSFTLVPALRE